MYAHHPLCELLADEDSETDLVASIETNYHIDLAGVAELTLWEVMRWCAGVSRKS